eukprot:Selendium_serpulae@DN4693_c0_g1_i1.p1
MSKANATQLAEELKRTDTGNLKHAEPKHAADGKVGAHVVKDPKIPLSDEFGPLKKAATKPKLELQNDRDWSLENYRDHKEVITIADTNMKQNVVLRDCVGVTATVPEKINKACIDRCKTTNLIVKDVISSLELIHCERVKVQVTGKVQSVAIDNCNGVTIYLNKESVDAKISSSRSGEMNVCFPNPKDPEDIIEKPIPEQFVSHIKDGNIVTEVSDLYH